MWSDSELTDLNDLLDKIAGATKIAQAQEILQKAIQDYGLAHVAYFAINLPTRRRERPLVAVTYAPEWQKHYMQQGYVNIDPVVRAGLSGVLPIDWASLDQGNPVVRRFFGEAKEFKIGLNGVSIPVRGRHGEFALFSATTFMNRTEWEKAKHMISKNLFLIAYYFHDWALKTEKVDNNDYLSCLTAREKDCLRWRALGKSDWDVSQVLSISERTVKFHLENARHKLGSMNTTHAVAKALSLGLIAIP
jgi:DNA-binding CsgD family transcriptional regulator